MADKRFYQMAADEVRAGQVDQALRIKIGAEYPSESDVGKQAQYIRLRAAELSNNHKVGLARRLKPQKWWQWLLYVVVTFFVADIVAAVVGSGNAADQVAAMVVIWVILMVALVVVTIALRSKNSASHQV